MTQEHDIRLAYINTLLDSGYTRLLEGTENPTIGYIVGGVDTKGRAGKSTTTLSSKNYG